MRKGLLVVLAVVLFAGSVAMAQDQDRDRVMDPAAAQEQTVLRDRDQERLRDPSVHTDAVADQSAVGGVPLPDTGGPSAVLVVGVALIVAGSLLAVRSPASRGGKPRDGRRRQAVTRPAPGPETANKAVSVIG